jgi:hypothetical protein
LAQYDRDSSALTLKTGTRDEHTLGNRNHRENGVKEVDLMSANITDRRKDVIGEGFDTSKNYPLVDPKLINALRSCWRTTLDSVIWKRVSIPWTLVYGYDMSQLYVAMSATSLSPSKGQDGFDVFEVVKNIILLMKGVYRN